MSDEWKFKQRKQETPGVETPRPRLVTKIPLEPRKEKMEPKAERPAQTVPPQYGYVPQAQSSGHGGMTGYPPPVAGAGYAHEYTPYPPGYPQPYAPPMGGYPPAMPEAAGQPGYGYYAATPAGPIWQPYYPPYGVPQGMPYGYGYPYGMPPISPQREAQPGQGIDPRATAQPMPYQPMPFQAAAMQGAQPMESRPSGFEPNEPGAEAQTAQPRPAFQAAYPLPQAYPEPQMGVQAREIPQANPVPGAQAAPAARTMPVEEPSVPITPAATPDAYAHDVAPAYPAPQWSSPAQGMPQAVPEPEITADAQRLEVTRSTPAMQLATQPESRQDPMASTEAYPASQGYPSPMDAQAREIPRANMPGEALEEARPEPTSWQPAHNQAETTVQAPWAASAAEHAPWSARVRQEEPLLQAVRPSQASPEHASAEGTVERRRRSWRGPDEDGAMAAPVEKAAYTVPFYSQPVDSDTQLVTRDDDDDDTSRFYAGELREIPTPVTVPLMLNTVGSPARVKKKGRGGWLWLLPVVLLLGSLSAVFFTGTADSLLMRAGIPTWEELTVEKIPDEDLPSIFTEETAAPGSLDPSLPWGGETDMAGDASQAAVPVGAGVAGGNLPVLSSFTVRPDSGTVPVTLIFAMQSNNAVKSIQLAKATGEKLIGRVTSAPSGDGIAWQFEVRFDKAYEGEIRALMEGQEKGDWYDTDLVCRVTVN